MKSPEIEKCTKIGSNKKLSALLMHQLNQVEEDEVLNHLRTCPKCLSNIALILQKQVNLDTMDKLGYPPF
ncbi:MAG TPA: zf-HC2 domain-containing protein [bacterium]|jgi:hypothetical protein